jgi:hypothetical protein
MPIVSTSGHYETSSLEEEVLDEWVVHMGGASALAATITAEIAASGSAVGIFRVRAGGTTGEPDGTVAAQISSDDPTVVAERSATGRIISPGANAIIKLTGFVTVDGQTADIDGAIIDIEAASIVRGTRAGAQGGLGEDLWLDVTTGDSDLVVTPAGDWALVAGREALRQSLLRRFMTIPGEWATLPDYGAGARAYVKKRNSRAVRDELAARLKAQALRDARVASVDDVQVAFADGVLKLSVRVIPRGHGGKVLVASMEVS